MDEPRSRSRRRCNRLTAARLWSGCDGFDSHTTTFAAIFSAGRTFITDGVQLLIAMRRNKVPDPSWKSGPTYPEPTASEHRLNEESDIEIDGVGINEAEQIGGEPLCAVREYLSCTREGCDANLDKNHVYALSDVSERVQQIARNAIDWVDEPADEDVMEWLAADVSIIDYDETPIIGFEIGEDTVGYVYPQTTIESDELGGACYGKDDYVPEPHDI